jgi:hypothetical protein
MTKASEPKAKSGGKPGLLTDIGAGTKEAPAPIESAGPLTIVRVKTVVAPDEVRNAVLLPPDASVGDVVEVYFEGCAGHVYGAGDQPVAILLTASGAVFRKIDDASWRFILGS